MKRLGRAKNFASSLHPFRSTREQCLPSRWAKGHEALESPEPSEFGGSRMVTFGAFLRASGFGLVMGLIGRGAINCVAAWSRMFYGGLRVAKADLLRRHDAKGFGALHYRMVTIRPQSAGQRPPRLAE